MKVVYRSKEDSDEVKSEDAKLGHLHLVSFPRRELDDGIEYVRQQADITRKDDEPPVISTTGVGCTTFGKLLAGKINIKVQQQTEFDCFMKSFYYLVARLPRPDLLEPFDEDAVVEPVNFMKDQMAMLKKLQEQKATDAIGDVDIDSKLKALELSVGRPSPEALAAGDKPLSEAEDDVYPCIMAICGSGFGFMRVDKDGTFRVIDGSFQGGRSFLGLATLLTGRKTFTEIMELATKGNNRNVDQFTDQLFDSSGAVEGEQCIYTELEKCNPSLLFCFGRAIDKSLADFNPEDLARAMLVYTIVDLVQCLHNSCRVQGIKRVFFCGSFCNHPLSRRIITTEFVRRSLFHMTLGEPYTIKIDFLKPGSHLGALGCAINDFDK